MAERFKASQPRLTYPVYMAVVKLKQVQSQMFKHCDAYAITLLHSSNIIRL